jgi:hypothetical protein
VVGMIPAIGESRSSAYSNKQMHGRHFVKLLKTLKKKKSLLKRFTLGMIDFVKLIMAVYFSCHVVTYCNTKLRT